MDAVILVGILCLAVPVAASAMVVISSVILSSQISDEERNKSGEDFGISDDFIAASNHPYGCRCDICKKWWADMGTEWEWNGPFTEANDE